GSAFKARDLIYHGEPLATLGESLVLTRVCISGSGFAGGRFDVGPYEREEIGVTEVDAQGRRRRIESFPPARLGAAAARLSERYAPPPPAGAARTRAAATARSITAIITLDANRPPFAHDMECVDHRALGLWSARGAAAALRRMGALFELADDVTVRIHDVLGARSDAILWRSTFAGTDRASGGAFEHHALQLRIFGADGLQTRLEFFDADSTDEALTRFDELTAESPAAPSRAAERPVRRRLQANAATAHATRMDAAIAARDVDTLATLQADDLVVMHHPTGAD